MIIPDMLDFAKLSAPADHGDVLVSPDPPAWLPAARANSLTLRSADALLLDSTLAEWRRRTRERVLGRDDALVFVTGHQPEFIHPGVWAKHIVADRAARAADGMAINLVVDNDAPRNTNLTVPEVTGEGLAVSTIPSGELRAGCAYEQVARLSDDGVKRFRAAVERALGDRFQASQMPTFFAALAASSESTSWVDQVVSARRAVEHRFDVSVDDRRVSDVWCSPLIVDMLARSAQFVSSYNAALAKYRTIHRVRGTLRPIPDLHVTADRVEIPLWAYRGDQPRQRVYAATQRGVVTLFAEDTQIGVVPPSHLRSCEALAALLADLGDWRLRPRALTLTIWARLFLADMFVHGIGGAKYDRISDFIIADYYGVTPPHMACVSATLHLDLPAPPPVGDGAQRARLALRDLHFNPQRHGVTGDDVDSLVVDRAEYVRRSLDLRTRSPRDRRGRREAFARIRDVSRRILVARSDLLPEYERRLAQAERESSQGRIARSREYFFGLYNDNRLRELMAALPDEQGFRV